MFTHTLTIYPNKFPELDGEKIEVPFSELPSPRHYSILLSRQICRKVQGGLYGPYDYFDLGDFLWEHIKHKRKTPITITIPWIYGEKY